MSGLTRGERRRKRLGYFLIGATLITGSWASAAVAECNIADAKLEESILSNPKLRGPENRQPVRDLRVLRDAAFTLRSYGLDVDCERLLGNIRELVASPSMGKLGDNDEEEAVKQMAARDPLTRRGTSVGHRADKDSKPLVAVDELRPGLRGDEIIGAEVRSADDKIVGEVRNIVLGAKDRPTYLIVASSGFFLPGRDSIVVPIGSVRISAERNAFFLPIPKSKVGAVPLMPDQDYGWLADQPWLAKNDAFFATLAKP